MNAGLDIESLLTEWFKDDAAPSAPDGIHANLIARAGRSRQHVRSFAALRVGMAGQGSRSGLRLAYLAALAAALVVLSIVWSVLASGVRPSPSPTVAPSPVATGEVPGFVHVTSFVQPFTYVDPPGSGLERTADRPEVVAWAVPSEPRSQPDAQTQPDVGGVQAGGVRGVVVASAEQAWSHRASGAGARFAVRPDPADLLADLRQIAGVRLSAISSTRLDGRPTWMSEIDPGSEVTDIHVNGSMNQLSRDFVMLNVPASISVLEVGDDTVFILIWARTTPDLEEWMPVATELVDSIRFAEQR